MVETKRKPHKPWGFLMADVAHTSDGLPRPNGGPAAPPRNFKKRWAQAVLAYDNMGRPVEDRKAAGHVAMAFKLYMEMDAHGRGAAISDEEFARACGVTSRTAQEFKKWLLASGFVIIRVRGSRRGSTEFEAMIPGEAKPEDVSVYSDEAKPSTPEVSSSGPAAIERTQPETSSGDDNASADFQKNNPEIVAAKTTGNPHQLPEVSSGQQGPPEPITGNSQPSRVHVRANTESPTEIVTSNKLASLPREVEETSAEGLNGAAASMLSDIVGWMNAGDEHSARQWLKTLVSTHGQDVVKQSYLKMKTDILEGTIVVRPLAVWSQIANRIKAEPAKATTASGPNRQSKPSGSDRRAKIAAWADEVDEHKGKRK